MSRYWPWVLLVLLMIFGLWWFWPEREIVNYPPAGETVAAFGDSLVAGVGDPGGGGFVEDLSQRLDREIINEGRNGDTASDGLERIENVLRHEPDTVLLLLGGNDFLQDIDRSKTRQNLAAIIKRLQDEGAVVVLLGVRGGLLGDPAEDMYENLAKNYGTLYISKTLDGIFGRSDLMADRLHPNSAGYEKIADRLEPNLRRLLEAARQR